MAEISIQQYANGLDLHWFDAARALHWYCVNWHQGQSSELYRIMCQLKYSPGMTERGADPDDTSGVVYSDLEARVIDAGELLAWIERQYLMARD